MTRKRTLLLLVFLAYIFLTVWKWDLLWKILVALVAFVGMIVAEGEPLNRYWNGRLFEYWVAAAVWFGGGVLLLRSVVRAVEGKSHESSAQRVLMLMGFIALTAPIVTPVLPYSQGDPVSTRLLPPFTRGVLIRGTAAISAQDHAAMFTRLFKRVEADLLFLSERLAGESSDCETSSAGTGTLQRVIFLLGTDDNGRDVLSRVVYGGRVSLFVGLVAALGAVIIGTLIGFLSGYGKTIADTVLMRFTDAMLAIPSLFLVVGAMAFLPSSLLSLVVVLSLTGWMAVARTVRTEVLRLRHQEFVLAAKLLNQSSWKILVRHIIPNIKPLLLTVATLQFSNAILAEASLSFLGLGVQPPTPSWGNMLGEALSYLGAGWWLGVFPGCALAVVLIASHSFAERIGGVAR